MKKHFILFFSLFIALATFAQKNNRDAAISDFDAALKLINSGNIEDVERKLVSAKTAIDLAFAHSETSSDFKTMKTKGDIYFELNSIWAKTNIEKAHQAAVKSYEGYARAKDISSKTKDTQEIDKQLRNLQINTYNQAINNYNATNFNVAQDQFIFSMEVAEYRGEVDAQQVYVTGMACDMVKDYEKAYMYYRQCAAMGYGDSKLFVTMLNSALLSGNSERIKQTIADGKAKYPRDPEFTVAMSNAYLIIEDYVRAEETLQEAIKNNPTHLGMNYAIGTVYEKLGKTDQAIDAYRTTLSIDPNYFEANFSLGAIYFNEAVNIQQDLNNLDFGDPNEKTLEEKHRNTLIKSEVYLKKAYDSDSNDYGTISALMTIYAQLEMTDDYTKMKAALDRIKNGN